MSGITKEALEWALEQIYAGESQASIAKALGCSAGKLSEALSAPEYKERSAHARLASAEAWLDKGLDTIYESLKRSSGIDSNAARAYAQECARRAAIRNPVYREKTGVEVTGKEGGPIQTIAATVSPEVAAQIYKEVLG